MKQNKFPIALILILIPIALILVLSALITIIGIQPLLISFYALKRRFDLKEIKEQNSYDLYRAKMLKNRRPSNDVLVRK